MQFEPLYALAAAFGVLVFLLELHERCTDQMGRALRALPAIVILSLTVLSSVLVWDLWVQQNSTLQEATSANAILAIVAGLSGPHFLNGYLVTQAKRVMTANGDTVALPNDVGMVFIMDRLWKWLSDTLAGSTARHP